MKSPLVLAALLLAPSIPAAPVYWFGAVGGSTEGGAGTWDTANNHFSISQGGPADTPWSNTANPGDPVFEGTPGTVTLSTITLNGTLTDNAGYTFLSSTMTLGASSALNVTGANTLTVSNLYAGGPLTKNGSGTLLLTGPTAQSYGNNTVLNGGTIALGAGNGATFGANGPGNHLVINADGVTIAQRANTSRSPQAAVDQLGDVTFDMGVQTANVDFTLAQGYWKVSGNRKITTTVGSGTGVFIIGNGTGGTTVNRMTEYSGPASLTKDGSGTLTISCENDITGGLTISSGTLRVPGTTLYPFGSGTLTLGGGSLATTTDRGTTPITNAVSVTQDSTITTSSTAATVGFVFSGGFTGTSGSTLTFTGNTTVGQAFNPRFAAGFAYAGKLAVNNNGGPTTLNLFNTAGNEQSFINVISGTGSLKRSATTAGNGGITYLIAPNTYSGGTTLNDGGIGLGINSTPGPNEGGPPLNDGPIGTGTLTVAPGVGSLPLLFSAISGCELGNAINLANTAAPLTLSNAGTMTLYGLITGSGSLTKIGAGQLRLSPHGGNNTYSGGTTISGGEIAFDANSAAGTGPITNGNGAALSALSNSHTLANDLFFSGTTTTLTGGHDLTVTGSVDLGGNNVTLTVDNSGLTTLSGQLSDGGLTKAGTSTLVLSGTSSYAGGTTVTAGTLQIQKDGGLGGGNVTIASGATLRMTGGSANTYINSAATLTLNGASPLVKLDFAGTPNTIGALYFGAVQQPNGTWGPVGSGASHESAFFTGTGMLQVGAATATPVSSFSIAPGPGSSLTLSYAGGSGSRFVLLRTNNLAAPLSLWTRLQTNASSPGTFPIIPGADPQEFYRVKSE
jgi:fibronectin-binding autotransporter adhesin